MKKRQIKKALANETRGMSQTDNKTLVVNIDPTKYSTVVLKMQQTKHTYGEPEIWQRYF